MAPFFMCNLKTTNVIVSLTGNHSRSMMFLNLVVSCLESAK